MKMKRVDFEDHWEKFIADQLHLWSTFPGRKQYEKRTDYPYVVGYDTIYFAPNQRLDFYTGLRFHFNCTAFQDAVLQLVNHTFHLGWEFDDAEYKAPTNYLPMCGQCEKPVEKIDWKRPEVDGDFDFVVYLTVILTGLLGTALSW